MTHPAVSRLTRLLAAGENSFRCPHCDSIIYSRRWTLCGVCSRDLPKEMLFAPHEIARLENLLRAERRRHRQWRRRAFLDGITAPFSTIL